jgi:hypothetical protein
MTAIHGCAIRSWPIRRGFIFAACLDGRTHWGLVTHHAVLEIGRHTARIMLRDGRIVEVQIPGDEAPISGDECA